MSHYKKHVFVCVNQRPDGKKCCNNANALKLAHDGHIRAKFDLIDKKIIGNWVSP